MSDITNIHARIVADFVIDFGNYYIRLTKQATYKLGLFLTGHNWGGTEGKVRYMGDLAEEITFKYADYGYPPMTISDYIVESESYDSNLITFVFCPGNTPTIERDKLGSLINHYLESQGLVKIPYALTGEQCINEYKSGNYNAVVVESGKDTSGDTLYLSVKGSYINHVDENGEVRYVGIFAGNQSVSRPSDVGRLFLNDHTPGSASEG